MPFRRRSPGVRAVEPLPPRLLLAADGFAVVTAAGTLVVTGTPGDDVIEVVASAAQFTVTANDGSATFPAGAVRRVRVDALDGDDRITLRHPRPSTVLGGAGDDTIVRAPENNARARLDGGDGFDVVDYSPSTVPVTMTFTTFAGEARARGEVAHRDAVDSIASAEYWIGTPHGDDVVTRLFYEPEPEPPPFPDFPTPPAPAPPFELRIDTAGGRDRIHIGPVTRGVTVNGGGGNDWFTYAQPETPAVLQGGRGDDTFSNFDDDGYAEIDGGAGRDTVHDGGVGQARMGLNTEVLFVNGHPWDVVGNDGDNEIRIFAFVQDVYAGGGNDLVIFEPSATGDEFGGGAALGTVFGGDGNDTIHGSVGADTIDGGAGDDVIHGNAGNDVIRGRDGDDRVNAGPGNDRIWGDAGADRIDGSGGDDLLRGGDGPDTLRGGTGSDRLEGGGGTDLLLGDTGNDLLLARDGERDRLSGGTGRDSVEGDDIDELI